MTLTAKPLVLQAIDALNQLDRDNAVALLRQDLDTAPPGGDRWKHVARLAAQIGEKGIELEALSRFARTQPQTLDHVLAYAQGLARYGRSADASALLEGLPPDLQSHPAVLHFCGMLASEGGDFSKAIDCFHRALQVKADFAQAWLGLSAVRTFTSDDPYLAWMEALRPNFSSAPAHIRSVFLYALGKAWHDSGDFGRATAVYADGAATMRSTAAYDPAVWDAFVDETIANFSDAALTGLRISRCDSARPIFITGLPRSGTTLVEQIVAGHSTVTGGGEMNLTDGMFLPLGGLGLADAKAYDDRARSADPWGELARTYLRLVSEQFGTEGLVTDKTLNQSRLMGLLLHALPQAKVVWVRRAPEDNALSIYRTHFRDSQPWTWSLTDIARHMRGEDRLFDHWTRLHPERILPVSYETLVQAPQAEIGRILHHLNLASEAAVFTPHKTVRPVMTASVAQVRAPISSSRIGAAKPYDAAMEEFRNAYYV